MIFQNVVAITELWPKSRISNFLKDQLGGICQYCRRSDIPAKQLELHFTDFLGHSASGGRKWYLAPMRLACLSCHNRIHIAADALVFAAEAGVIERFLIEINQKGGLIKEVNSIDTINIPSELVKIVYQELVASRILSCDSVLEPEITRRICENRRVQGFKTAITHMVAGMI